MTSIFFSTAICNCCRIYLNKDNLVSIEDYSSFKIKPTRKNNCDCPICEVAHLNNQCENKYTLKTSSKISQPQNKVLHVCPKCFSVLAKGISHHCNKQNKIANVLNISQDVKEQVASAIIRKATKKVSQHSIMDLNQGRGSHIKVKVLNSVNKNLPEPTIGVSYIQEMKEEFNLSAESTKKFIAKYRKLHGRNTV